MNTDRLSLTFAGERSWRICFNGSLFVKGIESLYSVVKEHERRKSSFLYTALENRRNVTNIQNFFLSTPNYLCNTITANNGIKYFLHFISGQKSVICITFLKFFLSTPYREWKVLNVKLRMKIFSSFHINTQRFMPV